jgi:F0F1-type ATP synthase delta subunit
MNTTAQQYALAWHELLSSSPKKEWGNLTKKILNSLYKNGKLNLLPEIIRSISDKEEKLDSSMKIMVESGKEIDSATVKRIIKEITNKEDFTVNYKINPQIIGGIKIESKSKRWDLSVNSSLEQLKRSLT